MQGSGKGTQAKILAEKYQLKIFEMGGALRAMIASGSELGNKIKATVESGNLVSDEIVMEVVEAFLSENEANINILFDGIPRTMHQAGALLDLLKKHNRDAFGLYIEVSEEEAVKRMLGRGRNDDNQEVIQRRIENYRNETVPVIKDFYDRDRLIEVDGEQSIESVAEEMVEKAGYLFN